jgi:antitoxin component YwqK of YwqJK toxin-antitoxin module
MDTYLDGQRNGAHRAWHSNGQLESQGNYVLNQREGEWTYWTEDGRIDEKASGPYKEDKRVREGKGKAAQEQQP